MTSVDDLFRKPHLPSNNKRRLEPVHNPDAAYKSAKHTRNGDVKTPRVEDEEPEEDEADDIEAGPALPPEDEEVQDDEEGRFFGEGVSRDTADVLDFMDEQDQEEPPEEKIDQSWLRRQAIAFEKRISKNAELRAKFENDPQKFVGSEADLDAAIKALSILSDYPGLYTEFAKLGMAGQLALLLAHDNTDIAIDALQIIAELLDEDVEAEQEQTDHLIEAILDADLPSLLVQNLERLDEVNDPDRNGVYYSLSILESLASQTMTAEKVAEASPILKWLLQRARRKEPKVSQNKQYAAEVLAIFLQSSTKNRSAALALDIVDAILQILAAYRKRDPEKDSDEEEFVENLFDCLTCLVESPEGKQKFIEAEGVELALIMLREGKLSKQRALRTLDHALGGATALLVAEKFIEDAGLKTIFSLFMKHLDHAVTEHVLGILASLLRLLPDGSAERIRLLAKCTEKDHEKIHRLIKLRTDYVKRLKPVDDGIKQESDALNVEEKADLADEFLSRRLDAGLYSLQTVNIVLSWLIAEDTEVKKTVVRLLAVQDEDLNAISASLKEQLEGMDAQEDKPDEERLNTVDMLQTLIDCLI